MGDSTCSGWIEDKHKTWSVVRHLGLGVVESSCFLLELFPLCRQRGTVISEVHPSSSYMSQLSSSRGSTELSYMLTPEQQERKFNLNLLF